jgi:tetratricopeptide (TPR) repeat protein
MTRSHASALVRLALAAAAAGTTLAAVAPARAQDSWKWPEKPQNIQVLSKDITGAKLSPIMRGFTRSLGVRCTYCHVGEEGRPLSSYDFVSDANPNKDRAREMYRMLGSVNGHLKKITPSGERAVNMWCHTCHQGRPRPLTLEEDLGEVYRKSGIDAAIARYRTLKEKHFGRGGYDFAERSLTNFGNELLEQGKTNDAIAIFRLNSAEWAQSSAVWYSLAEAYARGGKPVQAEVYYRKAIEVDPQNLEAIEKLKALAAPAGPSR